MTWRVPLADLDYGIAEEQAVLGVLRSRWLTMGAVTRQFEEQFATECGAAHAIAVANATQALHLACLVLGIGPGDEVIVPTLTFVATANAVLYAGGIPRFADIIDPEEPNIDPQEIERLVTPRTKAVIVMHYAGYPCRMDEILALAKRYGLAVIEDAAHAPGAKLNDQALGTWGDIGCFSFFSNKNLATGEGGMLVTQQDRLAEKLRLLRSHGMTSLTWDRHQGHAYSYDVIDLGYNYRIDEIHSALGLAQLSKLAANNLKRGELTQAYWQALADQPLTLPFRSSRLPGSLPACHIFPILLPDTTDRAAWVKKLHAAGIQTSLHYPPVHRFAYYRQHFQQVSLPKAEAYAGREVTLPLFPTMTAEQAHAVIEAVVTASNIPV